MLASSLHYSKHMFKSYDRVECESLYSCSVIFYENLAYFIVISEEEWRLAYRIKSVYYIIKSLREFKTKFLIAIIVVE
jgi:hypothetical protein